MTSPNGDPSRPPLTPLPSRDNRDSFSSGIFRANSNNGQHRGVVGVSGSGSGGAGTGTGTPRQRGGHGGAHPHPSSTPSPSFGTPPSYRSGRHPVLHSRSYGSASSRSPAGSLSPASSSVTTPRRRGAGADFDPYLEVPNLYHQADDNTEVIRGLVPLYNGGGRTSGGVGGGGGGGFENGIGGSQQQHRHHPPVPGTHPHTGAHAADPTGHHSRHHGIPLCSRKRTRRRAAACLVVAGLIGAQYLYAIRVGNNSSSSNNAANAAVEAVAAAVSGAVSDFLGAAAIAGISGGGLGGANGDVSDDATEMEGGDPEGLARFTTGTSQRSNATVDHRTQSRRPKRVNRDKHEIIEVQIPRLLFVGSARTARRDKSASKKGERGGPSLVDLIWSVRRQQLSRAGKKQSNSTSSTTISQWHKVGRKVKIYPAEQTDETQLYPEIDSSDPPYNETMLYRSFPPRGQLYRVGGDNFIGTEKDVGVGCHPSADWQSTFHPTCNSFHDIDAGVAMISDRMAFLGAGHWRGAWSLDVYSSIANNTRGILREDADAPVVYKTWSYEHRFEDFYYELNRIDAVAMERLTSSPYAINIYGVCGTSSMTQFAAETLTSLADSLNSIGKLRLIRKISKGLSHVHGIGGNNRHASLVHNDLNAAHILLDSDGKTPLIHDFNIAQLLLLNDKEKPCGFVSEHWSPQWRSPEEIRSFQSIEHEMLTEKIDIYALGNIIYRFLTGQRAWRLGPGSMTKEYQKEIAKWKSEEGRTPSVPEAILRLRDEDKYIDALLSLMERCFAFSPSDRPSAKDIVRTVDRVLAGR